MVAPLLAAAGMAAARVAGPLLTRAAGVAATEAVEGEVAGAAASGVSKNLTGSFLGSAVGQLRGSDKPDVAEGEGAPKSPAAPTMPSFPSRSQAFTEGSIGNLSYSNATTLNNF